MTIMFHLRRTGPGVIPRSRASPGFLFRTFFDYISLVIFSASPFSPRITLRSALPVIFSMTSSSLSLIRVGLASRIFAVLACDLKVEMRAGRFRDDLMSRIDLWTFELPGLRDRREDIEPNLAYELDQYTTKTGRVVTFNKEGRERFLKFAKSPGTAWPANFRDLNGAVTRMATLAPGGRITVETVKEETARLRAMWAGPAPGRAEDPVAGVLGGRAADEMDLFDRAQLAEVIRVCRLAKSLSEAGRMLFSVSRRRKKIANDADRLRKYLARFGLDWRRASGA